MPAPAVADGVVAQIVGTSPTDVWAIGSAQTRPLTMHWEGTGWNRTPQEPANGFPAAAVAIGPTDAWLVGVEDGNTIFSMHWDGTIWRKVPVPPQGRYPALAAIDAVSPTDVWAAGAFEDDGGIHPLVMHWDGSAWTRVPAPDGVPHSTNFLYGITAQSADDIWAVGYQDIVFLQAQPLIEHWDGTIWSVVSSPELPGNSNYLFNVSGASPADVWAVGARGDSSIGARPLIEHWDGNTWSVVSAPGVGDTDALLDSVAASSATDVWAVGERLPDFIAHTLAMHWDGTRWSIIRTPSPDSGGFGTVAAITATDVWAGGAYFDQGLNDTRPLTMYTKGCG